MSTVTCRTSVCAKNGEPIELDLTTRDEQGRVSQVSVVKCGACDQLITDIKR